MSGIDATLFPAHQQQPEPCPQCGAPLLMRRSKAGLFLGCSSYPQCDYRKPLASHDHQVVKPLDAPCPECGQPLAVRQGRFGLFIACSGYPACHYHTSPAEGSDGGQPCPLCADGQLVSRVSRYGKKFWSCNRYPDCSASLKGEPLAGPCPDCGAPTLESRRQGGRLRPACIRPGCGYLGEPL